MNFLAHARGASRHAAGAALVAALLASSPSLAQAPPAALAPQNGFWTVPTEPGGLAFAIESNSFGEIYAASFVYNESGQPIWYVVDSRNTNGLQSGQVQRFVGGQSFLNRLYTTNYYDGSRGTMTFAFTSPTTGTITLPTGRQVGIQRQNIVANGVASGTLAAGPSPGWWFNSSQSGRGYFLETQAGAMVFTALVFDDMDQPVWYTARGAMTTPTVFTGELLIAYGGQVLEGDYRQPNATWSRGTVTIQFASVTQATVTLPDGTQDTIVRYTFTNSD